MKHDDGVVDDDVDEVDGAVAIIVEVDADADDCGGPQVLQLIREIVDVEPDEEEEDVDDDEDDEHEILLLSVFLFNAQLAVVDVGVVGVVVGLNNSCL